MGRHSASSIGCWQPSFLSQRCFPYTTLRTEAVRWRRHIRNARLLPSNRLGVCDDIRPTMDRDTGGPPWFLRDHDASRIRCAQGRDPCLPRYRNKYGGMRRFSFVHIMQRMGFGAADVNFYATYLDDTFYRRIYCDARVGFLAECFSPRIRLYRGARWMDLWDTFLSNRNRSGRTHWTRLTRACTVADEIIQENALTEAQQLMPGTVLGALHRHYKTGMTPYDSWPLMETLVTSPWCTEHRGLWSQHWNPNLWRTSNRFARETDSDCVTMIARGGRCKRYWSPCAHTCVPGRCVCDALRWITCGGWCKPWPGGNHPDGLLPPASMIPRTPQIAMTSLNRDAVDARCMAEWLWSLTPRTTEDGDSELFLVHRVRETMCAPAQEGVVTFTCPSHPGDNDIRSAA